MNKTDRWVNFSLGQELNVSGTFIYNGLRRFYEIKLLDHPEETFEVLYNLSIGFERLLKVALALLEFSDSKNPTDIEKLLKTHDHLRLLDGIRKHCNVDLSPSRRELLKLLGNFYGNVRYDRFSISSTTDLDKERDALATYMRKHLNANVPPDYYGFGTRNTTQYKRFLREVVKEICSSMYKIVSAQPGYTHELRYGSKAQTVFLGGADIEIENTLWKELLLFFMNTKSSSDYLELLRSIEPLEFDPAMVPEYLDCFQSDAAKSVVADGLEELYEDMAEVDERRRILEAIGDPNVHFP